MKKAWKSKLLKTFLFTGSVCFTFVTFYMCVLLWKSYVWYNWLHQLQDTLNRSSMGGGPII